MMVVRKGKEEPKSVLFQRLIHSHLFIRNFIQVMQIVTGVESYKFFIKWNISMALLNSPFFTQENHPPPQHSTLSAGIDFA